MNPVLKFLCATILIITGLAFGGAGLIAVKDEIVFFLNAEKGTAVVTEADSYYERRNGHSYSGVDLSFYSTVDGVRYETTETLSGVWSFKAGDIIDLKYNPNDPTDIRVGGMTSVFISFSMPLIGAGIVGLAIVFLKWSRKKEPQQESEDNSYDEG